MSTSMWVLILMLNVSGTDDGAAIHSIEFETKRSCRTAREAVVLEYGRHHKRPWTQLKAVCVEK